MRGRNTENQTIEENGEVDEYQGKRHVVLKFIYEQNHVIFNPIGEGRRRKEICNGIQVFIAIVA